MNEGKPTYLTRSNKLNLYGAGKAGRGEKYVHVTGGVLTKAASDD